MLSIVLETRAIFNAVRNKDNEGYFFMLRPRKINLSTLFIRNLLFDIYNCVAF